MDTTSDPRRAAIEVVIARRAFQLVYQPIVHLAVDDAGAGYATFRHVLRLRPDIIKMDQSITQRLDEDPARMALATALVIFAGEIGAILIAEGVETAGEVEALRRAGVARAQGYVLGRPQALPLVEPAGGRVGSADVEQIDDERELSLPPSFGYDSSVAATAHALLSPVGGIDIALELLRRKTSPGCEEECRALIGTAQRQLRLVGSTLQDMMRGLPPEALVNLNELNATVAHAV